MLFSINVNLTYVTPFWSGKWWSWCQLYFSWNSVMRWQFHHHETCACIRIPPIYMRILWHVFYSWDSLYMCTRQADRKMQVNIQYKIAVHYRPHHSFIAMCMAKKSFFVTAASLSPSSYKQIYSIGLVNQLPVNFGIHINEMNPTFAAYCDRATLMHATELRSCIIESAETWSNKFNAN